MSEQKLRKFRLVDKEGYISTASPNSRYYKDYYLSKNCFEGHVDTCGELVCDENGLILIDKYEFQFFEEIPFEEEGSLPKEPLDKKETVNNDNETPSNEVSATFSDEMLHCIKEACQVVDGSLCFYKEGVVFLWNEDEYFIESVDDYYKVINSIKVLNSFKK